MNVQDMRVQLKRKLTGDGFVTAPGIFEMISLRVADRMGFDCLYMTGFGTVASYLGEPDAGLATYSDMVNRVTAFCRDSQTPIICDGDTGYGGLLNVAHTVKGYERAGAAAIQLEDQEFPKKCGHTKGRRVIPCEDMVKKIQVATEARTDPNFLIVARTDARSGLGLDEALRRGEAYVKAGADVLFVESPESVEELEKIGRHFDVPLLVNIVEGGRTPQLPPAELKRLGFSLAIYPASGFLAMTQALEKVYSEIKAGTGTQGTQTAGGEPNVASTSLYSFEAMCELMGFPAVWKFDSQHAQ
jgi:2-methylisocitrate lyase-like PEP mutase family enzyme